MSPADKPLATLLSREQVQGRRVSLVCGIRIRRKRMAGSHPTETSRLALGNGAMGQLPTKSDREPSAATHCRQ